ncbi:N66 matrix protein-like [Chenopodium quinoa]|uniref:N66 matrix protein-like n=1 Tax=Chenopodium quinoa TaxID=63459 RepID=UPI000B775A64|nr:N66 matrix protein-like [Chenopodium quinoa]
MSVQEYAEKFNEYARFCPNVVPDERSKAQKFKDGLTFRIQKKVIGARGQGYRHKRKGNGESSSNPQGYDKRPRLGGNSNGNGGNGQQGGRNNNNQSNNHRDQGQQNQQGSRNRPCRKCDKSHPGRNCNGDFLTCFECGEVGHKKFDYPKKHNGNNQAQNGQGNNNGNKGGGYGRNSNYNNRFNNNNSQGQNGNAQGGNGQRNNNG